MALFKKLLTWVLTLESRLILAKYKPFIVAVTGSVGKTSTKDAIYCVFKHQGRFVRKSEKSLNSDLGLPLTIIGAPNAWRSFSGWFRNVLTGLELILIGRGGSDDEKYPDILILEIGADHPGDIQKVGRWLRPDIAVITRVSRTPVHVEFFSSPEQVFEEKAALAKAVKPGGTLILYVDDPRMKPIGESVKNKNLKIITFGVDESAAVKGANERQICRDGSASISFSVNCEGKSAEIKIKNALGESYLYASLAAIAAGKSRGVEIEASAKYLGDYEPPKGRLNVIAGQNGSTIIDDTYNSSPDAVRAALKTLGDPHGSGRKIAVLGDMMELGRYSAEEHKKVGKETAGILGSSGLLITVGQRSRATADEALRSGMTAESVKSFDLAAEAAEYVSSIIGAGDIILVKGSQSIRMERVVKVLLKEPEKAGELLVRQEREWLEKP